MKNFRKLCLGIAMLTSFAGSLQAEIKLPALSDKCEPVSEWPVTVALCRTELAPLGESGGAVKLEIGP